MCKFCPNGIPTQSAPIPNCFNVPKERWDWTWKAFDQSRTGSYNENSQIFEDILLDLHNGALEAFEDAPDSTQGMTAADNFIESEGTDMLLNGYRRAYEETAKYFARGTARHIKQEDEEDEDLAQLALLAVRDYLTINLFQRVDKVRQTNQRNSQSMLRQAMRSMLDIPGSQQIPTLTSPEQLNQVALMVRRRLRNQYAPGKAKVMSITETATASNLGLLAAARGMGVPMDKGWLSQRDSRVRTTHVGADGQRRRLNQTFDVGGFQMMFPGDWSRGAPADELINCRCVLIFFTRN